MEFSVDIQQYKLKSPFRIAGRTWETSDALVVTATEDGFTGHGEAQGVFYLDESAASIRAQVEGFLADRPADLTREQLQELLPPGGARNAIDCALWDLEAKKTGQTIWQMTGITPKELDTVFTIGLEAEPEDMGDKAGAAREFKNLKIKLNADRPIERMEAIQKAHPQANLVVDVNEGWDFEQLVEVAPHFDRLGVKMIEQPLPRGEDAELEGYTSPVPLCADESCLHRGELSQALERYQMINIKLDKTGGLTEALKLAEEARQAGLTLMVGNMTGTSLAMAPSFVIGQFCAFVDLDGPLLLASDCDHGMTYDKGRVSVPDPKLWG